MLDLGKRAADVAIRPADNPPPGLVGRRVASIAFAIYAGRGYLARRGKVDDLSAHPWVAPSDDLGGTSVARWMRVAVPNVDIAFKANSLLTLRQAAAANLGLAPLPCYLGDRSSELVRVHPPVAAMTTALWVLLHEDLRRSTRIRAFTSFVAAEIARQRPLIEGRSPMIASNETSVAVQKSASFLRRVRDADF